MSTLDKDGEETSHVTTRAVAGIVVTGGDCGFDPRETISRSGMSPFQWVTVAVMVGLSALDGYDVLSVSFAAPGIAQQWGIDRAALGVVLSMETVGMAFGSIVLGSVADRAGRRTTILACLSIIFCGMAAASLAGNAPMLCLFRLFTGIGVGGMMAATTAGTAEAASGSKRSLCVALVGAGYPLGAVIGGKIAAHMLLTNAWPIVFAIGAVATLSFFPLVLWLVPESIDFLVQRRAPDALLRINHALSRMGHPMIDVLPPTAPQAAKPSIFSLFSPPFGAVLLVLATAYSAQVIPLYFLLKWTPKIIVDMGYTSSAAGDVLVTASIGGICGSVALGLLSTRFKLVPLIVTAMVLAAIMIAVFGDIGGSISRLSATAALAGCFANAGVVGLYALFTTTFPVHIKAAATGWVIGVGRGASSLAPIAVGFLFNAGASVSLVAPIMAGGSLVAAAIMLTFRRRLSAARQKRVA